MLRVALQRAWRPTAGALVAGAAAACERRDDTADESLVQFWFDGAQSGYDKRWGDRESASDVSSMGAGDAAVAS